MLDTALQQMMEEVQEGGVAKADVGVMRRQGRHRSNGIAAMIGGLLASAGFTVLLACWDLFAGEYEDCFGRRRVDDRGPCGCRIGNCTFLRASARDRVQWNTDARRVGEDARGRFAELAERYIPQWLLRGRLSAWLSEKEPQAGAALPAAGAGSDVAMVEVSSASEAEEDEALSFSPEVGFPVERQKPGKSSRWRAARVAQGRKGL